MSYFAENCSLYLNECLNYPISTRCSELARLIDCGSIKDLHDFYPTLVKSIFSGPGWGLRTMTQETNPLEFDYLYNFFIPLGPMLRLCYRLLSEPIKFEASIESLPSKTKQMLNSGRFSVFYSDIVNVDPCRRQVTSLHLNSFDYFMFHFVIHGMLPLHKMFPAALTVHNDHLKTVYYYLSADYLCSFLPTDPNATVMPANVFCSIKSAAPVPISPMMPLRTPKYLSSGAITHNFASNATNMRTQESSRSSCWRTETVLHLFVDTWLRFDVDESPDLPSSEFIRVLRILVKTLHAFANSADIDVTPMAALRSLAQPMMNAQMNVFLRSIIQRWPLDSSFSVVLELWLCYIQPWRYTLNKQQGLDDNQLVGPIPSKYERFILENSATYTQIFIQLLPRFERLDFGSLKNVSMLYRLTKVFGQSNLSELLRSHDMRLFQEHLSSPIKASISLNVSTHSNTSPNTSPHASAQSIRQDVTDFYETPHSPGAFLHRSDNSGQHFYHDDDESGYVCMFGPNMAVKLQQFVNKILLAYENANQLINHLETQRRKRYSGIVGYIKWYLVDDEDAENTRTLNDAKKISDILDFIVETFANIFANELPNIVVMFAEFKNHSREQLATAALDQTQLSDDFDATEHSPRGTVRRPQMLDRIRRVQYKGDPSILPACSNEIAPLVRLQYKLAHYLNQNYSRELENYYKRPDIIGFVARHTLDAPRTIETFEKSNGVSRLVESRLGPRINLRWMASYRTMSIIAFSLVIGKLVFGRPILGFIVLIFIKVLTTSIVSAYDLLSSY